MVAFFFEKNIGVKFLLFLLCLACQLHPSLVHAQSNVKKKRFLDQRYFVVTLDTKAYKPQLVSFYKPLPLHKGLQNMQTNKNTHPQRKTYAINASYFDAQGKAIGLVKQQGTWLQAQATDKPRATLGWATQGENITWYVDVLWQDANGRIASILHTPNWWHDAENILQGAGLLLRHGQATDTRQERLAQDFVNKPYARSVFCLQKDGKAKLLLIKGTTRVLRLLGLFKRSGLNLHALTQLAKHEKCYHAINLEGGYSSQLLANKQITQGTAISALPYRKVTNALVFTSK